MRILKIILIIVSFAIIGMSVVTMYQFTKLQGPEGIPNLLFIVFGLLIIFPFFNILYHIKSFRFYRRKQKQRLDKKLHKIFWVAGFLLPAYLFFLLCMALYNNAMRFAEGYVKSQEIVVMLIFVVVAGVELLETSALRKRIKKLKENHEIKNEIDDIGASK